MKHMIKNDLGEKYIQINREVTRVKALIINSNNEILLGYSNCSYQFIGGHLEKGETLISCLNREIKEEVGIDLKLSNIKPFLLLEHYCRDHPVVDENINCKVYYYVIKTDKKPDLNRSNQTIEEKKSNLKFEYIKLDDLIEKVINNFKKYKDAEIIGYEMINAYNVYKKYYKDE